MKRLIFLTIIAVMLIHIAACTSLLDQNPHNSLTSGNMWKTEEHADQGVAGIYSALKDPLSSSEIASESVNLGHYAFDLYGMTMDARGSSSMFQASASPNIDMFARIWKWCYTGIHRANNAIAYIPDIDMNAQKKARLIAESKVLRAFFYMRLNELYGSDGLGVPVYLEPISPTDANRGQTPEAEVWANVIIKDLTDAINEPALPDNYIPATGRISKGAAYAFRGRVYLLAKEYNKAILDFAKVGDCGYKLYNPTNQPSDYKQLFKVAQERCEEMIFSVQYIETPTGFGSKFQKYLAAYQQGAKAGSLVPNTDFRVSKNMAELYETIVDANTVKPFTWSDYIPEWESITDPAQRKVFFIRDTKLNGMEIHPQITNVINRELNSLPSAVQALYLKEGNEARIKAAFANRDPRLAYNVITPYSDFLGRLRNTITTCWYTYRFPVYNRNHNDEPTSDRNLNPLLPANYYSSGCANAISDFCYLARKFVGEGIEYEQMDHNPVDEPLIRYADILLMWAEALVELNDLPGAMAKVKQIRDRIGIPTMASSFANQTIARNYVRDERRRELMTEGINYFDELRWRTLKETKFDQGGTYTVWGGPNTTNIVFQWIGDHYYTWPVPRAEVEMNPNLQLTPGWHY
ncbi:RagB/SusD family nutrient uptake outer membrane protein [Proteiniphilum sp.]|uniref:RagB/SusD family nutrient uptake outer membrane protein n=1 Tax=Proteiniphilum sp. TaxID=1926877 RepID=UPI00332FAC56